MPDISFVTKGGRGRRTNPVAQTTVPAPTPNVIDGLQGVAVVTQLVGQSTKVVHGSAVVASFSNSNVSGWTKQGATLRVTGPNPVTLNFINAAEATIAETRLGSSINGNLVV